MKKKILYIFFMISFPVLLFAVLEVGSHGAKYVYENLIREEIVYPTDETHFEDLPGQDFYLLNVKRTQGNELVWSATYKIERGTEIRIPLKEKIEKRLDSHINLLGGSFTFGVNLNDEGTLAGHFSKYLGDRVKINNFGIPGGGPHDILKFLDLYGNRISNDTSGNSYYFFIDDHIPRSIIDLHHIEDFYNKPFYCEKDNGEVGTFGSYSQSFPILSYFLRFSSQSLFLRKIGFNPPLGRISETSSSQALKVCKLLKGVKDRVQGSFPQTKFKIVFLPEVGVSLYLLGDCLNELGVGFIDLTNFLNKKLNDKNIGWDKYYFPDSHPRSLFNEEVIQEIIKLDSL